MNVWIICHPSFVRNQPFLDKNKKGSRLAAVIRKVLGVKPIFRMRTKDTNYLFEDVAPQPERYPDLIFWTGRIGSRVSFNDNFGGRDRHYWGDGEIAVPEWVSAQIPDANPVYIKISEGMPTLMIECLALWACRRFKAKQGQKGASTVVMA